MTFKDPDVGKPAKQLKKERYARMHTARTLGVPDRVPVKTVVPPELMT